MRHLLTTLISILFLACNNSHETKEKIIPSSSDDKVKTDDIKQKTEILRGKTVLDVVNNFDKKSWLFVSGNPDDQNWSTILHFNMDSVNRLSLEFSPECWGIFPIVSNDSCVNVMWPPDLDTKYNFDIVKEINKVSNKFNGKIFMTLTILNDTTLKAKYLDKDLLNKFNACDKERVLFPDKFHLDRRK